MPPQLQEEFGSSKGVMALFGSPSRGLFDMIKNLRQRVRFVVNLYPEQKAVTVRTEEAMGSALYLLRDTERSEKYESLKADGKSGVTPKCFSLGHRKHSAPRRGSLAYRPRARAGRFIPSVHTWPKLATNAPTLLGFPAVKVATMHSISLDDREKTPNFGKPLFNPTSVLAVPETVVVGLRLYARENGAEKAVGEVYAKTLPKGIEKKTSMEPEKFVEAWKSRLSGLDRVAALVSITPSDSGISQKKPIVFEVGVGGGDIAGQVDYVTKLLGKGVKFSEIFKAGNYVDVIGITKGKGFEGPVTRFGIKRKQHKSRKSVRAVGVIGPWHPAAVMYTVARAGQHGFHQRTETGKRILVDL